MTEHPAPETAVTLPGSPHAFRARLASRLLIVAAVAVLCASGVGRGVSAGVISRGSGHPGRSAKHACPCHTVCQGGSCCCAGKDVPDQPAAGAGGPASVPAAATAGACVGPAPCRGDAPAGSSSVRVGHEPASPGYAAVRRTAPGGRFLRARSDRSPATRSPLRIDEPPEDAPTA